jgi:hypothetical protein
MKKLALSIIVLLALSLNISAAPWATVTVAWKGACTAYQPNTIYRVHVWVTSPNVAGNVFDQTVVVAGTVTSTVVGLTEFCTIYGAAYDYTIHASVEKLTTSDPEVLICSGKSQDKSKKCDQIITGPNSVGVILN